MFQMKPLILAAATLLSGLSAQAEDPNKIPLGSWSAACDGFGIPATCTSDWQPGQHASHVVQTYAVVRASDGAKIFSGRGLYRLQDGKVDGIWEDSRGAILDLAGRFEDGQLSVIWGDASDEIGRSVYTFSEGEMQARDAVLTETGWREFMAIDYRRAIETPATESD
ncbi:MAG: hypothetical protein ACE37M_07510 [Henriciella sp.]